MDDTLLVRVLDGVAYLDEQVQPLPCVELVLIAVGGELDSAYQFHHEVGPARIGRPSIQHASNVRMIHQRQRLTLGLEPGDDTLGVHP